MKKILIAFLGSSDYQDTTYVLENKHYESKLAFMPVLYHYKPFDVVYVIGTRESRWGLLQDVRYTPIYIPYGNKEADFWDMFEILNDNIDLKDSSVIFDITHCFRAVPLFASIYVHFLKYVEPTAYLDHFFYGIFEKGKNLTPIVDLAPVLDLFEWIDAATSFVKYGELEGFSLLLKKANNSAWKRESNEKPKSLGQFSKRLGKLSDLSRLTYVPLLSQAGNEISEFLRDEEVVREITQYVKPFSLIIDSLLKYTNRFHKPMMWESHLEAAKWYLEHKRITQSLLVLRETVLTSLCEKEGCDPYDLQARERRENYLNEKRGKSRDKLTKLWQKITDARNRAGHALMRRYSKELSPQKAIKEVEALIKETEQILGGDID